MAQNVAALEIAPVASLLEDEVLRKMRGVVAQVQPCHIDILRPADNWPAQGPWLPWRAALLKPEHAELSQFIVGKRISRARITPAHVPGVFLKNHAHIFFLHLLVEHRAIEVGERPLHVKWQA